MRAPRTTRHFVAVGDRQVHLRKTGAGPPVLLVHESPMTGLMLMPLARALAGLGFTAYALDTPGYGGSDSLPVPAPAIADYADGLVETMPALGLSRPYVYGSHTGAMIALELGLRQPKAARSIIVDGLPLFTRAEAIDLRVNWLTPYEPRADGTHLLALWHRYRDHTMFWPFYRPSADGRFELTMPAPESLHERLVDWLLAGDTYPTSYHAAFDYEGHARLGQLRARTALTAHHDDLLGHFMDRLPKRLGRRTETARMPKAKHPAWISRFLRAEPCPDAPPLERAEPLAGRVASVYASDGHRQLLVRRRADTSGRPIVLLPDAPDTGSSLRDLVDRLGADRPALAFDLPGTGASDPLPGRHRDVVAMARSVARGIGSLGHRRVDLYGRGVGGVVALELAIARPRLVERLVLDGFPLYEPRMRRRLATQGAEPLVPRTDGSHLIEAWTMVRDHDVFFPWFDRTQESVRRRAPAPPAEIHRRTLEVLKAPATYHLAAQAAAAHPLERQLRHAPEGTTVVARPTDVAFGALEAIADLSGARAIPLSVEPPEADALLVEILRGSAA